MGDWPALPSDEWGDTLATLHRWVQIVGQTRFALSPPLNHWWHAPLYLTVRGLTTSPIPFGGRTFAVDFDLIEHDLLVRTSDGATRALALVPRTVADFHREYLAILDALGIEVEIEPKPVQTGDTTPFAEDRTHASYESAHAHEWFRALVQVDQVLKRFRGGFIGKASPVHLFWGRLDLCVTLFSGRPAPEARGGDEIAREAYSHEHAGFGFWPGGGSVPAPAFYAYFHPEPRGFREAPVRPASVRYVAELAEFSLPYDDVRSARDPAAALMEFLRSAYEAGTERAGWDRTALEHEPGR
jgi:hypothetical protein